MYAFGTPFVSGLTERGLLWVDRRLWRRFSRTEPGDFKLRGDRSRLSFGRHQCNAPASAETAVANTTCELTPSFQANFRWVWIQPWKR